METDVSTFPDLDPLGSWITGAAAIGQRVARRFMTPHGSLWYDTDFGLDLRSFLNEGMTEEQAASLARMIEDEAGKDEAVLSADVTTTWTFESGTLTSRIALETAAGPYAFTLAIDKVSATILRA